MCSARSRCRAARTRSSTSTTRTWLRAWASSSEPRTFEVGDVDLAVCSADKHVAGPRAGVFVGRKDLVEDIGSRIYELGLEAQAGQYVGVANALRDFDPEVIKQAGELAKQLLEVLQGQYGAAAYLGGPGVSMSGDDVLDIASEQRRRERQARSSSRSRLPASSRWKCSAQDGILTIGAVSMPGSAPVVRLMMYPDGRKLGVERIAASLENAISSSAKSSTTSTPHGRSCLGATSPAELSGVTRRRKDEQL